MAKEHVQFSEDLFSEICELIADGKGLREICRANGMPNKSSFLRWVADDDKLRDQYARARDIQADVLADEIIEIADDVTGDPQRDRLRVDARKWKASKMAPKKYGDKLNVGGDEDNPLAFQIVTGVPRGDD